MKTYRIDLHKMRHDDARDAVIRFVEKHWSESAELEIVTGNSSMMRNIVMDILEEYKLEYEVGRKLDFYNKGYIITWTG